MLTTVKNKQRTCQTSDRARMLRAPVAENNRVRTAVRSALLRFPRLGLDVGEFLGSLLDIRREVRHLEDLADLDGLVRRGGAALRPFDRLFLRFHIDHPIAAEHFLGLDEGTVGELRLPSRKGNPSP